MPLTRSFRHLSRTRILAFEGYQYAKEYGKGNEYNHRVLEAFFVEGRDIGDTTVLTKLAGEVGLDQKGFEEALQSRKYREAERWGPTADLLGWTPPPTAFGD